MAGVRERNCPSSSSSRFTAIRSARNVFVAGCSLCLPLAFRPPATTVARCSVSRMGRARTIALAILRESRLLGVLVEEVGQLFLRPLIHNLFRRQRRIGIHAHIERPAQRKENPRSGLSNSRLEIPRSASTPSSGGNVSSAATSPIFEKSACTRITFSLVRLQSLPRNFQRLRVAIHPQQPARW